jgi:glutaredoxin
MQNALVRLLRRRSPRASHLMFTVYTRRQCCCCHKAFEVLEEARKHHGFSMETVDVDSDSTLAERYGDTVPVVLVDGKVRFRGKVEPALLDRLLTAEASRARTP